MVFSLGKTGDIWHQTQTHKCVRTSTDFHSFSILLYGLIQTLTLNLNHNMPHPNQNLTSIHHLPLNLGLHPKM